MIKKYPYWSWLAVSILLWAIAANVHYTNTKQTTPEKLAQMVSNDLEHRIAVYKKVRQDPVVIKNIFENKLSKEDLQKLIKQPFNINAYEDGKLVFWNSNRIIAVCDSLSDNTINSTAVLGKNIFFTACDTVASSGGHLRTISLVIPLAWIYPFENDYLKSHWGASELIPTSTEVSQKYIKGYLPVYYAPGKIAFYIFFHTEDLHSNAPQKSLLWMIIAACIFSFIWLQLIGLHLSEKYFRAAGLLFIVFIAVLARGLLYIFGLPFHLQELELFSPQLYASSMFLPSLGDLLLNVLLLTWLCSFVFIRIDYKNILKKNFSATIKILLSIVIAAAMVMYSFYFVKIIHSLVADSMISFTLSMFFAINEYTIIGLVIIVLLTGFSAFIFYFLYQQMHALLPRRIFRYVLLLCTGILCILIFQNSETFIYHGALLLWLLLFAFLFDIKRFEVSKDLLAPHMIYWAVFICLSTTILLQYFNNNKEKENRKSFAARLVRQQDPMTEYLFHDIVKEMRTDDKIALFLRHASEQERNTLNEYIDVAYLKGHLNRYQSEVYLYDTTGKILFNNDTTGLRQLQRRVENASPIDENLFFKQDAQDGHYYLARVPILDSNNNKLGFLFVDMALKKVNNETVYPELLQPGNLSSSRRPQDYEYAVYYNGQLITQNGDYPFLVHINQKKAVNEEHFFEHDGVSVLRYPADKHYDIVVIYREHLLLDVITVFSYLLSIQLLLSFLAAGLGIMFRYLSFGNYRFRLMITMRRRIHYAMLGVVLISLSIIASITISFSSKSYEESNRSKLQSVLKIAENAIQQHIISRRGNSNPAAFEKEVQQPEFRYFVTNLAAEQRIDINIYSRAGKLLTTSQEDIYKKSLQSRIMRADAFQKFRMRNQSVLVQDEKMGELQFISSYMPVRNSAGTMLGFVNIPYFASQKELNSQISNLLVALINIYVFIFLLSGLLAVIITNNLTASLNVIINKFKNFTLQKNELLDWAHDDEIGLLVKEYNKMVKEVEAQAVKQAETERDVAWREMARQVAHEIKNPLTPMKLNIQYLQQALAQNKPNVKELAQRVSVSLIEQIDNLNYIASEFSNFAKLPEAKAEDIELNDFMKRAVELNLNESGIKHVFEESIVPLHVITDKSQLMSVCTNLLQNALQAMSLDREGEIIIKLERENDGAIISIKDNGTGIHGDVKDKIFKPYFTTKSSGTGLGLAMTRKIIESWQGSIWFETAINKGTSFFIKLPLKGN